MDGLLVQRNYVHRDIPIRQESMWVRFPSDVVCEGLVDGAVLCYLNILLFYTRKK